MHKCTRPESRSQEDHEATKPNNEELQHIFNQFDETDDDDHPDDNNSQKRISTSGDSNNTDVSSGRRPSLADIKRTADETKGRERQEIPFDFNRFLEQMRRRSATPIKRYFKRSVNQHVGG